MCDYEDKYTNLVYLLEHIDYNQDGNIWRRDFQKILDEIKKDKER
jgi:hypothetical protein